MYVNISERSAGEHIQLVRQVSLSGLNKSKEVGDMLKSPAIIGKILLKLEHAQ
jgi:hypothetical protein